jgi:FkbM family methyltransferase
MKLSEFVELRRAERDWSYANGYNNPDPATNGEFSATALLAESFDVFLDVGANSGRFTEAVRALAPNARVHCFEPNGTVVPRLTRSVPGVDIRAIALSDEDGETNLHVHEGGEHHSATASLHPRTALPISYASRMRSVRVTRRKLDSLRHELNLEGQRLMLKIDVEGHELPVMRGAEQTLLGAASAAVIFEHSFAWRESGESLTSAIRWLNERGFEIYRILPMGLEHVRTVSAEMEQAQYCNYLAERQLQIRFRAQTLTLPMAFGETFIVPFAGLDAV